MEPETKPETKVCSNCERELPITEFALNKTYKDGHNKQCKDCINAYQRQRYARKKGKQITPPTNVTIASCNPKFSDKTPRELQQDMRELKEELIARGFNCEIKLTYLHEIKI